jgi:hypothetical protein
MASFTPIEAQVADAGRRAGRRQDLEVDLRRRRDELGEVLANRVIGPAFGRSDDLVLTAQAREPAGG